MSVSRQEVVRTYRNLYTTALRASRFSQPSRFVIRDHLRSAFRSTDTKSWDRDEIGRTLHFLRLAGESAGLEHKVFKNVVSCWHKQTLRRGKTGYVYFCLLYLASSVCLYMFRHFCQCCDIPSIRGQEVNDFERVKNVTEHSRPWLRMKRER